MVVLFVVVLLVNYLIADGKSHWFEGVMLLEMYLIIAIATWYVVPLFWPGARIVNWVLMFHRLID